MSTDRTHLPPTRIADETFLIHDHLGEGIAPFVVPINTMLIRGEQPVVVDTGAPIHRARYLDDLFSLVDPTDVRWVFLSHDDIDHAGNLVAVLTACPNATLVTGSLTMLRLAAGGVTVEPQRFRGIEDGGVLDVGDRALVAQRPPLYDAPTTFGLLDTSTDVYWGSDCFAAAPLAPTAEAIDVDPEEYESGFVRLHQWNSPWLEGLDTRWWHRVVSRFADRDLHAVASCHGPLLRARQLPVAIDLLRELPAYPVVAPPGRDVLDELVTDIGPVTI